MDCGGWCRVGFLALIFESVRKMTTLLPAGILKGFRWLKTPRPDPEKYIFFGI